MSEDEIAQIAEHIKSEVYRLGMPSRHLSKGQKWAVLKTIHEYFGGEYPRRLVCGWLFDEEGEMSAEAISPLQWTGLWRWVGLWYDEEVGDWRPSDYFRRSVPYILNVAVKEHLGELIQIACEKGGVLVSAEFEPYTYQPIIPAPILKPRIDMSDII